MRDVIFVTITMHEDTLKNYKLINILILVDDIATISVLADRISIIDNGLTDTTISITVLSDYFQVDEYVSRMDNHRFNIILLDEDCAAGRALFNFKIEEIGPEKIIAFTSKPAYIEMARKRGISKIITNDLQKPMAFIDKVAHYTKKLIVEEKTLYEKAKEIGMKEGRLSAPLLQRKLQMGYATVALILDLLESEGFVGPQEGARPRVILEGVNNSNVKIKRIVN